MLLHGNWHWEFFVMVWVIDVSPLFHCELVFIAWVLTGISFVFTFFFFVAFAGFLALNLQWLIRQVFMVLILVSYFNKLRRKDKSTHSYWKFWELTVKKLVHSFFLWWNVKCIILNHMKLMNFFPVFKYFCCLCFQCCLTPADYLKGLISPRRLQFFVIWTWSVWFQTYLLVSDRTLVALIE